MHTYVIINHDLGLQIIVKSDEETDVVDIIDNLIIKELCHAEAGI
jgi:hypothetical protein